MQTMMKSSITKLIYLLCLLLIIRPAQAQFVTTPSNAAIPLELKFLIESLNRMPLDLIEQAEIRQILTTLNSSLPLIEKPYRYFLIKREIYQSLLDVAQQNVHPLTITQLSITHLQKITTGATAEKYNLFALWLLEAIASDLWELSESPQFKKITPTDLKPPLSASDQLLSESNPRSRRSLESAVSVNERQKNLERKVRLVAYWYQELTTKQPAEFNSSLKPTFLAILRAIETSVAIFINFTAAKYRIAQAAPTTEQLFTVQTDSSADQQVAAYLTKGELNRYQELKRKEAEEVVAKIAPLEFTAAPTPTPTPSPSPPEAPTPAPAWAPKEQPSQLPGHETWKPVR